MVYTTRILRMYILQIRQAVLLFLPRQASTAKQTLLLRMCTRWPHCFWPPSFRATYRNILYRLRKQRVTTTKITAYTALVLPTNLNTCLITSISCSTRVSEWSADTASDDAK